MSINHDPYSLLNNERTLHGSSPLNPQLSPVINPLRARLSFGAHHLNSPSEDKHSLENFPEIPLRLSRSSYFRHSLSKEGESSRRHRKRPKEHALDNLEKENCDSPAAMELESSSSQPSEPCSGTRMNRSPFSQVEQNKKRLKTRFTENFYQRINDFLDSHGLDFVDPTEAIRGIRQLSWIRSSPMKENGQVPGKHIKSATQSPKLISDHIMTSTLFQRRASRSQGPGQGQEVSTEKPLGFGRPGSLNVFRNFKDDVHNILQCYSPIEEGHTPALSRNGSEALEKDNTPDRLGPKKSSFRQLISPLKETETPNEVKLEKGLLKYAMKKPFKIIRSPHPLKVGSYNNLSSPIRNSRDVKTIHSLTSSPTEEMTISPKKRRCHNETPNLKEGIVLRKSQFQKLRNIQEISP